MMMDIDEEINELYSHLTDEEKQILHDIFFADDLDEFLEDKVYILTDEQNQKMKEWWKKMMDRDRIKRSERLW